MRYLIRILEEGQQSFGDLLFQEEEEMKHHQEKKMIEAVAAPPAKGKANSKRW